jgi:hypothetical protein
VQRGLPRFERVGLAHLPPTARPGRARSKRSSTLAATDSLNVIRARFAAFADRAEARWIVPG